MREKLTVYLAIAAMVLVIPAGALARWTPNSKKDKKALDGMQRVLVLDGSGVHNVGELHMHVGNQGNFGSWPGSGFPFSEAPSAQWPAGSGVEYLFTSGLWVGALKGGVPAVTTAAYAWEFRPTQEPDDIIYRSSEGARGGNRLPSVDADDDKDGMIDEDWLNGHDDDLDGFIDEDFAAISKQMFSCWYTDDQPVALRIYPEHNPLGLHVRQTSFQWEEDRFDDFVGIEFNITNISGEILQDIYLGFFADCDAGPRDRETYWDDDATSRAFIPVSCTDLGPVQIDVAFTYDADGDEGKSLGYFGVMFLGHTTDPTGETAPKRVGISTYANFSGSQPFEQGGDPTNDFERYELLSQRIIERAQIIPRDYRMLVSAGPFLELYPDSTLTFQTAFVAGLGLRGMVANAAGAQLTYNGAWFNLLGDAPVPTGYAGRETPVYGEATNVAVDTCLGTITTIPTIPRGEVRYINNDCEVEQRFQLACGYGLEDSAKYKTGIDGNETQINWIVGTAPPPPNMRVDDHSPSGLVLYWDNFSETVPDVKTQIDDFEGYRVWRADNWARPLGSSADNGPSADLWKLLLEADIVNNFGDDKGLDAYRYEPLGSMDPVRKQATLAYLVEFLTEHPLEEPECPPGVTDEQCDTLKALARWELGVDDGRQYYRYVDRSMHLGRPYFYAVTAMDHDFEDKTKALKPGRAGDPASNFIFVEPKATSQPAYAYDENEIYVVPNPATTESMAAWALAPNNDDPTGIKVEFRNLPRARGTIRVYTLAGDLVVELPFDGTSGVGTVKWDLVSRNLQDVTSGVYIYAVESDDANFDRFISKFVVIR